MASSITIHNGKRYHHYMTITMPDGEVKKGTVDYRAHPQWLGLNKSPNLKNCRVLDIAANDGYWSFWAEANGAAEVVAIDVDNYTHYDWGYNIPEEWIKNNSHIEKDSTFGFLANQFNSEVVRSKKSVYDLSPSEDGQFDLVFNFGLLYHLRHPLLSLDRVRQVCRGAFVLRTQTIRKTSISMAPMMAFFEDDVFKAVTNWTGPTEACCVQWLKNAGFQHVFIERMDEKFDNAGAMGQTFVGVVEDNKWLDDFRKGSKLSYCDDTYFKRVRENTLKVVSPEIKAPTLINAVSTFMRSISK